MKVRCLLLEVPNESQRASRLAPRRLRTTTATQQTGRYRRIGVRGMTLMEVMLATFLVGLMMTLVWGGFAQSFDSKAKLEREIDTYDSVRLAMARMVRDLSMAYLSKNFASVGERRTKTLFQGKPDQPIAKVNFASLAHVRLYKNSHESDETEITYYGARETYGTAGKKGKRDDRQRGRGESWNLMRRESRRIDDDPERGGTSQVVAEGIKKIELHYWNSKECKEDCWKESWDSESTNEQLDRLPERVKISVTIVDENGRDLTLHTQTKVMLNQEPIKF